jgi:hypothetical protein
MRMHGPKVRPDVEELIAGQRNGSLMQRAS